MSTKIIQFPEHWRPLENAPRPGAYVEVKMKDGDKKVASVTKITSEKGTFLQFFHHAPRRRPVALDINQIDQWRPIIIDRAE